MKTKPKPFYDETEVGVTIRISEEADKILVVSSRKSERAKKREAKLRLEDHLIRFPDWKL